MFSSSVLKSDWLQSEKLRHILDKDLSCITKDVCIILGLLYDTCWLVLMEN